MIVGVRLSGAPQDAQLGERMGGRAQVLPLRGSLVPPRYLDRYRGTRIRCLGVIFTIIERALEESVNPHVITPRSGLAPTCRGHRPDLRDSPTPPAVSWAVALCDAPRGSVAPERVQADLPRRGERSSCRCDKRPAGLAAYRSAAVLVPTRRAIPASRHCQFLRWAGRKTQRGKAGAGAPQARGGPAGALRRFVSSVGQCRAIMALNGMQNEQ